MEKQFSCFHRHQKLMDTYGNMTSIYTSITVLTHRTELPAVFGSSIREFHAERPQFTLCELFFTGTTQITSFNTKDSRCQILRGIRTWKELGKVISLCSSRDVMSAVFSLYLQRLKDHFNGLLLSTSPRLAGAHWSSCRYSK